MNKRDEGYTWHSSMYTRTCYYCRNEGLGADHWPPVSWLRCTRFKPQQKLLVRCCFKCNLTLSNSNQATLEERRTYCLRMRGHFKHQCALSDLDILRQVVAEKYGLELNKKLYNPIAKYYEPEVEWDFTYDK